VSAAFAKPTTNPANPVNRRRFANKECFFQIIITLGVKVKVQGDRPLKRQKLFCSQNARK